MPMGFKWQLSAAAAAAGAGGKHLEFGRGLAATDTAAEEEEEEGTESEVPNAGRSQRCLEHFFYRADGVDGPQKMDRN